MSLFRSILIIAVVTLAHMFIFSTAAFSIDLSAAKGPPPQWHKLLNGCVGKEGKIAKSIKQTAASWISIIDFIAVCDIDSMRYYGNIDLVDLMLGDLEYLKFNGSGKCAKEADALQATISAMYIEMQNITDGLTVVCQADDSRNDIKKSKETLAENIRTLCGKLQKTNLHQAARTCQR